jgi:hypothetical protein
MKISVYGNVSFLLEWDIHTLPRSFCNKGSVPNLLNFKGPDMAVIFFRPFLGLNFGPFPSPKLPIFPPI